MTPYERINPYEINPFDMVLEFHEKFGLAIEQPFSDELVDLRWSLNDEENYEVYEEFYGVEDVSKINRKKLTKELADLIYVAIGAAVTFGLPLEQVFAEVHRSNMSKLGEDGKPIYREDGKVLKGPNYKEANLEQFFDN